MRQGQQNRRGRGRNRKGSGHHNPLTRSFESTGPDVKIRGTPAHIADKYMSLARDASASGDPVLAENYLQHAEHYNRIIMAYREQQMPAGDMMNGGMGRQRFQQGGGGPESDEFGDDDTEDLLSEGSAPIHRGLEPQPRVGEPQARPDDRPPRQAQDQAPRPPRERYQERQPTEGEPSEGQPPRQEYQHRRRERFGQGQDQPEFLRRPIRRPRREANGGGESGELEEAPPTEQQSTRDKSSA
jgi:hypothetical protein